MNLIPGQEKNIIVLSDLGRFVINLRRRYHPTDNGEYQAFIESYHYSEGFTPEEAVEKVLIRNANAAISYQHNAE